MSVKQFSPFWRQFTKLFKINSIFKQIVRHWSLIQTFNYSSVVIKEQKKVIMYRPDSVPCVPCVPMEVCDFSDCYYDTPIVLCQGSCKNIALTIN